MEGAILLVHLDVPIGSGSANDLAFDQLNARFVARAAGRTLTFKAANPSATEMTDEQTGSRWNAYGACSAGPMQGVTLEPLILEPEYWFAWSEFHRGTKIYRAPRLP